MGRTLENVSLAAGELVSIRDRRPLTVTVLEGRVWMTAENDTRDVFPVAGQAITAPAGQLAVIEALDDTRLQIAAEPGMLGRVADVALTGLAYGALRLLRRVSGLRLNLARGVAVVPRAGACRDAGC